MKNTTLLYIINAVLLIAVLVLFFLHFSKPAPAEKPVTATSDSANVYKDLGFAYVVADTLMKYYTFAQEKRDQLEAKANRFDQEVTSRARGLENEVNDLQRTANTLTPVQLRAIEENLMNKRQNLMQLQQSYQQQLMDEESNVNRQLYNRITAYLKEYGKNHDIQVILSKQQGSGLIYAHEHLDITQEVIDSLNVRYEAEQNPSAAKKAGNDTTSTQ